MTFREQAAADLSTFLNVDEFGETVKNDGSPVVCVLEGAEDSDGRRDGVIDRDVLCHARASSFYKVPVVGQRLTFGEGAAAREYDVVGVDEDQGMVHLRLRWFDS